MKCTVCRGRGLVLLTQCPMTLITDDVHDALRAADVLRSGGGWPNGVGWLNESAGLVEAVRLIEGQRAKYRRE